MKNITVTHTKEIKGLVTNAENTKSEYKTIRKDTVLDYTLQATDKIFADAEKKYNEIRGKMNAVSFGYIVDCASKELNRVKNHMHKGCRYKVLIFGDNSGYAKSCKYRKNTMLVKFIVEAIACEKAKIVDYDISRTELYAGEVVSDFVMTCGCGARRAALKDLTGSDCPLNNTRVKNYSLRAESDKRVWDNVLEIMADFKI